MSILLTSVRKLQAVPEDPSLASPTLAKLVEEIKNLAVGGICRRYSDRTNSRY